MTSKGIESLKIPFANLGGTELKNNSACECAARRRRAIEIAVAQNHFSRRPTRPICPTREGVNHFEGVIAICTGVKLVNGAEPKSPTGRSHSINIAMGIHSHPCAGTRAIIAPSKSVNHRLRPGSSGVSQLINYSAPALATARPAGNRRAIEIALRIECHTFVGLATIGATCKAIEHGMRPGVS